LENGDTALKVRQGDEDQLIKTARAGDGVIQDIWTVGGTNNKDRLLGTHSVNFSKNLIDHTVTSLATARTPSCKKNQPSIVHANENMAEGHVATHLSLWQLNPSHQRRGCKALLLVPCRKAHGR